MRYARNYSQGKSHAKLLIVRFLSTEEVGPQLRTEKYRTSGSCFLCLLLHSSEIAVGYVERELVEVSWKETASLTVAFEEDERGNSRIVLLRP